MKQLFTVLLPLVAIASFGQDNWTRRADFGGGARYGAFTFSIGSKGYVGTGSDDTGIYKSDFWEYDPITNTWTQKADFGGGIRAHGIGFSIGSKGYAGTGVTASYQWTKDMWEYNPADNTWTRKDDFAGGLRYLLAGFSIGNKGYVGTGEYREGPWTISTYYNDFWEFDPTAAPLDQWKQKASVPQEGRTAARGFRIGNKGYIGFGVYYYDTRKSDLWEYDPSTDAWTRKADLPAEGRYQPALFSIGNKGFLVGGQYYSSLKDVWEFDPSAPAASAWTRKADLPAEVRSFAVGLSIGDKGYVGMGTNGVGILNDWWQYSTTTAIPAITICEQTWMQKNLSVSSYRNGDPIPYVPDAAEWNSLTTGAWCYYNNDPATESTYGKLYNWYAVNDPRGLAPQGWHIPDNGEWITLENCAGGYFVAGGALKETGTAFWTSPNTGATNSTGFTALPGGMRTGGGSYLAMGDIGNWWSASAGQHPLPGGNTAYGGYYRSIFYGSQIFYGNPAFYSYPSAPIADYLTGMSVRCVKDISPSFTACPVNQIVYVGAQGCTKAVNYEAVATGNPSPTISYLFSGATTSSGAGTGNGQVFNRGITTVTINALSAAGNASCTFTVDVRDTVRPMVNCPAAQNLCYQSGGSYMIAPLSASDNCGIQSVTYSITGATVRSGNGVNASGTFNTGTSTILWRVTDVAGNVATCTTKITVNNRLTVNIPDTYPLLIWGKPNTLYIGFGPTCAALVAIPSGGTPYPGLSGYRYSWSNGGNAIASLACPTLIAGSRTFTVTVTDAAGCTATASKTIQVVDARCGPGNNEVLVCWFGTAQSCYKKWQVALALLYGVGGQVGPCDASLVNDRTIQPGTKHVEEAIADIRDGIVVYPNPSSHGFTISIVPAGKENAQVKVYDAVGRVMEQFQVMTSNTYYFGQRYKPGVYVVEVQTGNQRKAIKVIRQ